MTTSNPIRVGLIDHIVLRARDPMKLIAFYRDVLNCPEEKMQTDIGLYQLRAGQSLIDIVPTDGPIGGRFPDAPALKGPNLDHVCLQLEVWDEDAIRNHLEAHGVEAGPTETRYGAEGPGPSIYLDDPEGNTVELKGV
ncbi:MAG: VOC family protein [Pseudomonadota bacterium]